MWIRMLRLACLCLAVNGLRADSLDRFIPAQAQDLPMLWWVIPNHTRVDATVASWQRWLADKPHPLRPLPEEGHHLGLLAYTATQGTSAQSTASQWTIQFAEPLSAIQRWPSQTMVREVNLPAQAGRLPLPLPQPEGQVLVSAELRLPAVKPATSGEVSVQLGVLAPETLPWQSEGEMVRVDLLPLLQQIWPAAATELALVLQFGPDVQVGDRWYWQLAWQQPAYESDGYERLAWLLQSLLLHTGGVLEGPAFDEAQLEQLKQSPQTIAPVGSFQNPTAACAAATVWMANGEAVDSELISRWRDEAWMAPWQLWLRQPIQWPWLGLLGLADRQIRPIPGRALWPAEQTQVLCREISECASQPAAPLQARDQAGHWLLSDDQISLGEPLQVQWSEQRDTLLQGHSLVLDLGADASLPTGRRLYLLWLAADGQLWLRDGNNGQLRWRWRPSIWASGPSWTNNPAAEKPLTVPEQALQTFGFALQGQVPYVLVHWAGSLVVLDMTVIDRPRIRYQFNASEAWVHGVTGLVTPEGVANALLLSVEAADADPELLYLDWPQQRITARYQQPQLGRFALPWRRLSLPGKSLLFGTDHWGQVWQWRENSVPERIAYWQTLSEREAGPLALTQLINAQGAMVPVLAQTVTRENETELLAWPLAQSPQVLDEMPLWPSGAAQMPSAGRGFRWRLDRAETIAVPPRWVEKQLMFTTETAVFDDACTASAVVPKLYSLPWYDSAQARVVTSGEAQLQTRAPMVSAAGQWLGVDGSVQHTLKAFRRRLSKQAEPAQTE